MVPNGSGLPPAAPDGHTPLRRAELLAALSLAADLGMGQPLENAQRTAILAVALGRGADLPPRDLKDAYYLAFLRYVGCTADAPIAADVFGGDEIAARGWLALADWGKPTDVLRILVRNIGAGQSALRRARVLAGLLVKMPRLMGTAESHCEVAQSLADDLGCSVRVREALGHSFERWDGKGQPRKKKADAIPLAMRVAQVADDAQAFHRVGGVDAAVAMLAARAGKSLDPTLAETLRSGAPEMLALLDAPSVWDAAIAAEPGPPDYIDDAAIDGALQAMGAFADLKSSYTRGHSTGVAELAAGAATRLGLAPEAVAEVRRAGYVHDVGRAGVSAGVWEKEGPLTDGEWEKVRLHAYYTERILARPPLLARLAALGARDHERMDGTGYPHRMPGGSLPPGARVLAVADMYQAMRETRPHRRGIPPEEIAATLEKEAEKGRLDREAVRAVLETAGHRVARGRATGGSDHPGGLSDREVEVLQLVSRGLTNKEVAQKLEISARTVGHHLAHAYEKIGVTTRAGAAMFAMKNGIVGAV
ncbi:MAG TPA: HD domain-containing phosphohydrolase [Polyangia bacterium]|nr:HD domain-containing phosphohydrolase [Polyangia bacterium]